MSFEKQLLPLVGADAGLVLRITFSRKPLWFSECRIASVTMSQTPGAVMSVTAELARPSGAKRSMANPGASAAGGAGIAYSDELAVGRAVGEGVERYCAQVVDPRRHRILRGSREDLAREHEIPPCESFDILSTGQYARLESASAERFAANIPTLVRLRPDSRIRWVECQDLGSGRQTLLPMLTNFLALRPEVGAEAICEQVSTGFACHTSRESALLAGLCEVVERDAIMGTWLRRLSAPRVQLSSCREASPTVNRVLAELGRTTFQVHVNELTSDLGIPVYFATLLGSSVPYTIVGAGCHPVASLALEKALLEILHALASLAEAEDMFGYMTDARTAARLASDDHVATLRDHADRYIMHDLRDRMLFLVEAPLKGLAGDGDAANQSAAEMLESAYARVAAAGFRAYANELTIPEVHRAGLHVFKVTVPGLLPLNSRHEHRPTGSPRLETYETLFPRLAKFPEQDNPWAHPFP